jgi:ABC-2 type transport system ATP-binding protein
MSLLQSLLLHSTKFCSAAFYLMLQFHERNEMTQAKSQILYWRILHMINHELMIEAHDLRRAFGRKEAVAGISFNAGRGEIFGLLGPNGAGKTTTIRMLTGQIDPSGGNAVVAGCDIVKERAQLKERIGVVFEEQNLYERLSARLNLEFSCWLYGLPKSRVDEVLDLVRLRDRAKDRIRTFSNGMKQRMMIARALLHRPPMLFLDEPSRGLDPISAREVRQTVRQLSQEGITILLTTHLMEEADQLCQHVAFIVNGRLVANAIQTQSTFNGTVLDIGIVLASIVVLFLIAVWSLRRQAAIVGTI